MKGMFGVCFALFLTVAATGIAAAQPTLLQRCATDNLDPAAGEARLNWARRCALSLNVPGGAANWVDYGEAAANGGTLKDYVEVAASGVNSYVSPENAYEANYTFVKHLFNSGSTSQFFDAWGFYRWERAIGRKKLRPEYPTFGDEGNIYSLTNDQLWPHPTNPNDCTLYRTPSGTDPSPIFFVNGFCTASCYAPDQELLFPDGKSRIVDAVAQMKPEVITLTADSSLESFSLQTSPTHSYTAEVRDSTHKILEFTMASGGKLRVTTEHPMINGEGRLVQAQTLKVGDQMIRQDGAFDAIVSVVQTQHVGKVYNLQPDTAERTSHIMVAQGYLVGSSRFQNDEVEYTNRIILHSVPSALIP